MGKKKKSKKSPFYKMIKPFISDDRVMRAILNAAAAGVAWVAAARASKNAVAVEEMAQETKDALHDMPVKNKRIK
ncbi:MAG: hypothetical protein H7Z75_17085 [Ferruginibacter sp.]|nr:hypothetical protein [Cytophagales bacterium]